VHFKIDILSGDSAFSIGAANPKLWSNYRFVFYYLKYFKHVKCLATRNQFAWFWINISPNCQSQPELWQKNDISLLTLPPHTSYKLRLLNCKFCGPYGTYGNIRLNDWILSNPSKLQQCTVFQLFFENHSSRHLSNKKLGSYVLYGGLWGIFGCHRCTEFAHYPNWHIPDRLLHCKYAWFNGETVWQWRWRMFLSVGRRCSWTRTLEFRHLNCPFLSFQFVCATTPEMISERGTLSDDPFPGYPTDATCSLPVRNYRWSLSKEQFRVGSWSS